MFGFRIFSGTEKENSPNTNNLAVASMHILILIFAQSIVAKNFNFLGTVINEQTLWQ